MQVNINHPHAAVIAAFYNGKRVRIISGAGLNSPWYSHDKDALPFSPGVIYEIEPEVVVKYSGLYQKNETSISSACQFDSIEAAAKHIIHITGDSIPGKYIKYEYIDGVLTDVSLVSE